VADELRDVPRGGVVAVAEVIVIVVVVGVVAAQRTEGGEGALGVVPQGEDGCFYGLRSAKGVRGRPLVSTEAFA